jgi:hypothetical protein
MRQQDQWTIEFFGVDDIVSVDEFVYDGGESSKQRRNSSTQILTIDILFVPQQTTNSMQKSSHDGTIVPASTMQH